MVTAGRQKGLGHVRLCGIVEHHNEITRHARLHRREAAADAAQKCSVVAKAPVINRFGHRVLVQSGRNQDPQLRIEREHIAE